jgi:hypothetical protein
LIELSYAWHGYDIERLAELDEQTIITMWEVLDDINDARKDAAKGRADG